MTSGRGGRGGRDGGRGGRLGGRGSTALEVASRPDDDDDDEGEFRPGDWARLMKRATTRVEDEFPTGDDGRTEDAQQRMLTLRKSRDRVFGDGGANTWEGLGLPDRLISSLRAASLGFLNPTLCQSRTIPRLLNGEDVLIRAETGSGKTLSYLCPLFAALGKTTPMVRREEGTRALILVPTRELASQVLTSAAAVGSRAYHWIVCGAVVGGENKQKEKARLRKGVVLLIATPGRLLDHLRTTEAFNCDRLAWLVLDEADRLLDLGFEEDLNAILREIRNRTGTASRCTALLSATLTAGTSRLIDLAMTDPVVIEIDPAAEIETVENERGGLLRTSIEATNGETAASKKNATLIRMPEQLRHTAVEVPAKARLATLAGLLAGWMRGAVPKVMVFLNSCESVEFHYHVFSWLAGNPAAENGKQSEQKRDSKYSVFRLHGVMSQTDRRAVYSGFSQTKAGVLLCTDVGARGLDFENVGATVQVDPPTDLETYVHRVGRAARLGADGEAVLFLQPRETEYAEVLSSLGVEFGAASVLAMLDVLHASDPIDRSRSGESTRDSRRYERDPHLHPACLRLQKRLHALVRDDANVSVLAKDAFRSHVRSYATFPSNLKHIFHVKRLHLGHLAAAFGLTEAPGLIGKSATRERLRAAKDAKRKESVKAKKDAKEKRKRRVEGKTAPRKAARGTVVGM
jgi:ATP-dependent RNA helicase DDX31/DBP7